MSNLEMQSAPELPSDDLGCKVHSEKFTVLFSMFQHKQEGTIHFAAAVQLYANMGKRRPPIPLKYALPEHFPNDWVSTRMVYQRSQELQLYFRHPCPHEARCKSKALHPLKFSPRILPSGRMQSQRVAE